jgi:separase
MKYHNMASRAKARRPTTASAKKTMGGKAVVIPTEELTRKLPSTRATTTSKAKVACTKIAEEHSETPRSRQDDRISAMHAVNNASQGLTTVMKSGWKALSSGTPLKSATPTHEAFGLAASARAALEDLRMISPGDADVERAAISVAGKLLSLEMVRR